jgi:hypothetical protein
VIVTSIYRPGSDPPSCQFFDDITRLFDHLAVYSCPVIIVGDFNIHMELINDPSTAHLVSLLEHFDLHQLVTYPTHQKNGTIDLIITQCNSAVTFEHVSDSTFSDHFVVYGNVSWSTTRLLACADEHLITARSWQRFDISAFRSALSSSVICADPTGFANNHSVEDLYAAYSSTLTDLLDQHAPHVTVRVRRAHGSPWFDVECRHFKRRTRRAERKCRKTHLQADYRAFSKCRLDLFSLYRLKENGYWARILQQAGDSSSKRWTAINRLMCRSPSPDSSCDILPDQFLDYFSDKVARIRQHTEAAGDVPYSDFAGPTFSEFSKVTVEDVDKLIRAAPCKQCCLDPAPTWLVKECVDLLASFVTVFINRSLSEGQVPCSQKTALIRPLLKKCGLDSAQVSNYRPVSNLSFVSKILEKCVDHQLSCFLAVTNALPMMQSAYRKNHSTETALLKIHSDICSCVDSSKVVLLGLLDLSAAFDTVDHTILLKRLEKSFGISGTALRWIKSYFQDRTCYVVTCRQYSRTITLTCGLPQGSVLGPKLWLLYIKDLEKLITGHGFEYHGYSDDTQLYRCCDPTVSEVSSLSTQFGVCISDVLHWMKLNRIQLNPDKTECLWVRSTRCRLSNFPAVSVDGVTIQPSVSVKSLGVYLDQNLLYDHQLKSVGKACYYQLRQIRLICSRLDSDLIKSVLQAFISSRLDYCNSLYIGLPAYRLSYLQRIQNSAARVYSRTRKREHITPVLRDLHWLPVATRIRFKIGVFAYKAYCGQLPQYLSSLCFEVSDVHGHLLRSVTHHDLSVVRTATTRYGDRTFQSSAANIWNDLPVSVRSAESVSSFCHRLKTFLFLQTYG